MKLYFFSVSEWIYSNRCPVIRTVEAEEREKSYNIVKDKTWTCCARVVKKSDMAVHNEKFYTTEEEAKIGLKKWLTETADGCRKTAQKRMEQAGALEKFLCEMKAKEKGQ